MKTTVRTRLTLGFLGLLSVGCLASIVVLAVLSRSIRELRQVVTVADVIEHKALELRFDLLSMSDAIRGFLVSANKAEYDRKKQADAEFVADVEDIRALEPEGEVLRLLQQAAEMDEKVLNPLEDQILGTIAAGDLEAAKQSYSVDYLPLRAKQDVAELQMPQVRHPSLGSGGQIIQKPVRGRRRLVAENPRQGCGAIENEGLAHARPSSRSVRASRPPKV